MGDVAVIERSPKHRVEHLGTLVLSRTSHSLIHSFHLR